MLHSFTFFEIREAVTKAIHEKISFQELRERLPGVGKRQLLSTMFDLMQELGISEIPFCDAMVKPRLVRKPLLVSEDGNINIQKLLEEKGFANAEVVACPNIGKNKITITVKKPVYKPESIKQE